MSPQQKRPNMDVVEYKKTQLLDEDTMIQLRQCDNPEYVPDVNLFAVMFDAGSDWAKFKAETVGVCSEDDLRQHASEIAKEMTVGIQQEYEVCLPDERISQMYGMSHDFARLALGMRIPAPEGRVAKKGVVMRKRRIREYAKEQT